VIVIDEENRERGMFFGMFHGGWHETVTLR
jgi:hypothetical protein